jgi:hypothetical protein
MNLLSILLLIIPIDISANVQDFYNGKETILLGHTLKNEDLKEELFKISSNKHIPVGYNSAKRYVFGQLHLKLDNENRYFIREVYCHNIIKNGVGPSAIPSNDKVNTEHTWPQSKFSGQFNEELQKSDLHHLFPTDSKANGVRSSNRFAEVSSNRHLNKGCEASKSGPSTTRGGDHFFEPPTEHKGNVARALFYFSIRYKLKINSNEEEVLRRWNDLDPVDTEELIRNDQIEKIQGNRNPFIDFPNLPNDINRF